MVVDSWLLLVIPEVWEAASDQVYRDAPVYNTPECRKDRLCIRMIKDPAFVARNKYASQHPFVLPYTMYNDFLVTDDQ
jgi:hypothetical protein